jgi:hypothetical protein
MDGDSKQKKETRGLPADISDACNVLSTVWIRLPFQNDHGSKWIILDGRRGLLLGFRFFLGLLYTAYEILK